MTRTTSDMMQALAGDDAYPLLLLQGRLAFRKAWAMRVPERRKYDGPLKWEIDYDEMHNFARMGAEYVDADWGKPKIAPKKRKRSIKTK